MEAVVPTPARVPRDFPSAADRKNLSFREVADAYVASYNGRDVSRRHCLSQWLAVLGDLPLVSIDADLVADALDGFARNPAMRYLGRDGETSKPRWKNLGVRSPATLSRLRSALSAVLT